MDMREEKHFKTDYIKNYPNATSPKVLQKRSVKGGWELITQNNQLAEEKIIA